MSFRCSSFKTGKALLVGSRPKLLHSLMEQHQPALGRLTRLVKNKKQKNKKRKTFTHLPLPTIESSPPITQSQTSKTYFIIFSRIVIPHTCLKCFLF
jgi:hypothetical protein